MTPEEKESTVHRFDRIENKLDKLTDAVTKIVRVEEQMVHSSRRLDAIETRVTKNEKDINYIGDLARQNSMMARFADKIFWLVIAGAISVGVFMLQQAMLTTGI